MARLLVPTVLRPFGEHLAAIVAPQPGDVCVDLGGDEGVMAAMLARAAGVCHALADSLGNGGAQVVTSLFALADEPDPAATLREMLRVLDPQRGRLGVALWSEPGAVPHLDALTPCAPRAVAAATRFGFPLAAERLVEAAGGAGRVRIARIHDVVRFDGVAHWWAALGGDAGDTRRAEGESRLASFAAADGTLRLPTEAVLLTTER